MLTYLGPCRRKRVATGKFLKDSCTFFHPRWQTAARSNWFYRCRVHLNRNRLGKHLDRKDQPKLIFLSRQNAFHALQRSPGDPHPLPASQERMRLYAERTLDRSANGFDLLFRNNRRTLAMAQDHVHTRRANYLQSAIECSFYKHITRKQRQRKEFLSVLPTSD